PDAVPALSALRDRGLRLITVSNWDCSLPRVLESCGLDGMLDGTVTSAEAGARKPDPAIFAAALELAGVGPGEAVHVGDTPDEDVAGAQAAGIRPLLIDRDGGNGHIPSLQELGQHLWEGGTRVRGVLAARARHHPRQRRLAGRNPDDPRLAADPLRPPLGPPGLHRGPGLRLALVQLLLLLRVALGADDRQERGRPRGPL